MPYELAHAALLISGRLSTETRAAGALVALVAVPTVSMLARCIPGRKLLASRYNGREADDDRI